MDNSRAVFCWVLKKVLVTWKKRYSLTLCITITWGTVTLMNFLKIGKKRNSSLLTENYTHHMCTPGGFSQVSTLCSHHSHEGNITSIQRSSSCPSPAPPGLVLPVPEFYKNEVICILFCWASLLNIILWDSALLIQVAGIWSFSFMHSITIAKMYKDISLYFCPPLMYISLASSVFLIFIIGIWYYLYSFKMFKIMVKYL